MALKDDRYTYRVTWSEEDQEYLGRCAEFPSLSWLARTPEGALKGIRKVVADVVKDMQEQGEKVPMPIASRQYRGKFMVRVPPEVHRDLSLQAAEAGISLNRLVSSKLSGNISGCVVRAPQPLKKFGMENPLKGTCIRTKIISHYHKLSSDAFEIFQKDDLLLRISDVNEHSFFISCYKSDNDSSLESFYGKSNDIISYFLVSINVASLGNFSWDFQFVSTAPYILIDYDREKSAYLYNKPTPYSHKYNYLEINKQLVWRTMQLFLALGKEKDDSLKKEYIKGLYNFHNGFFDIDFANEAFSNFYKAFEFFCTKKILKTNKLSNEKTQLRSVLSDLGLRTELLEEFDILYKIRCGQAMHSQRGLKSIDKEDVAKLKVFLDSILHKYYQPLWQDAIKK
jgi:predicted HicB family RNase H-like nuclease